MALATDNEILPDTDQLICNQRIHLVAHSMGVWALHHAVSRLAGELQMEPLPRIFEHVLLMAADEDDDTFEHPLKLGLLPGMAKFVHVYHSRSDRILDVSDLTKGNPFLEKPRVERSNAVGRGLYGTGRWQSPVLSFT